MLHPALAVVFEESSVATGDKTQTLTFIATGRSAGRSM